MTHLPLETVLLSLGAVYAAFILFFWSGILRERKRAIVSPETPLKVSVIIPARNEAKSIRNTLLGLLQQTYPAELFEVIVVDDRSADDTSGVVQRFIDENDAANFRLVKHAGSPDKPTYKKNAIVYAMQFASGDIFMTTDGDCIVQPTWIETMITHFSPETGLVAGLIAYDEAPDAPLFHKLQALEFAGLVFAGVGAIGNRYPLICNGSNLAYRRLAFEEVGGFSGHEHIPSGDDDLFMQHLHRHTNWQVRYNLQLQSINFTRPVDNVRQFINQRARWGSKSTDYPGLLTFLALLVIYLFYVMIVISPVLALTGGISGKTLLNLLVLKIAPEYLVVRQALSILHRNDLLRYFILAEIIQPLYIVVAGFAGFFKLYRWK